MVATHLAYPHLAGSVPDCLGCEFYSASGQEPTPMYANPLDLPNVCLHKPPCLATPVSDTPVSGTPVCLEHGHRWLPGTYPASCPVGAPTASGCTFPTPGQ